MKILWFTWRDRKHPLAGGAELLNEEIAKRLARDGHEVTLVVGGYPGGSPAEARDGCRILRMGNRYTVYWRAYRHYARFLRGWADLVIDEMNTMPFFCKFYVEERNILFAYQLCREVWFYQMAFPLSVLGYLLEPLYVRLLKDRRAVTESASTREDLVRHGFDARRITVISVGVALEPVADLAAIKKYARPTLLSLGSIRDMKRTGDQVRAFEIAKRRIPDLQLKIAGDAGGRYGARVLRMIACSPYAEDIEYLGSVGEGRKTELMQQCHAILVTSVKEGWGLVVTEANSQGTPAIVYDADGLRDSVRHEETGLIAAGNRPQHLADAAVELLSDARRYDRLRKNAWLWSREMSFERCYQDFLRGIREP